MSSVDQSRKRWRFLRNAGRWPRRGWGLRPCVVGFFLVRVLVRWKKMYSVGSSSSRRSRESAEKYRWLVVGGYFVRREKYC
jgi:hypothetical protein